MVPSGFRFRFTSGAGWPGMGSKLKELRAHMPLKSLTGFSAAKSGEMQIEPHSSPAIPARNMTIPPQQSGASLLDRFLHYRQSGEPFLIKITAKLIVGQDFLIGAEGNRVVPRRKRDGLEAAILGRAEGLNRNCRSPRTIAFSAAPAASSGRRKRYSGLGGLCRPAVAGDLLYRGCTG